LLETNGIYDTIRATVDKNRVDNENEFLIDIYCETKI